MEISQIFTAPNQLTLLRMALVPFIVIELVDVRFFWALIHFCHRRLHRWSRRVAGPQAASANPARPISGSHCRQTFAEHHVPVLSILHRIPWKFTVLVFSRDVSILAASAVLFAISGLRDFHPSIFGKANTFSQIACGIFCVAPRRAPCALDLDYANCFLARNVGVHHHLSVALRPPSAAPLAGTLPLASVSDSARGLTTVRAARTEVFS
jgi:cardiolipin synthase